MKQTAKKLVALVLVLTMALITPVGAQAASVVKEETDYVICYPQTDAFNNTQQIKFSEKAKITSAKSSKKSVATVGVKKVDGGYIAYVNAKKVGKTTVTYKIKGVTHTQKVIVKKYINPYKKVTINGKDITAQFKKTNVAVVSYKKYKNKKVTLKFETKKNWAHIHSDYCKDSEIIECLGSFKYKLSVKKPKKNAAVETSLINHKDENADQYSVIVFK